MLDTIANRLARSGWLRHLFFLASAILAIVLVGYYFGSFDQAFHIPFLKKFANPALYPGDVFLDLRFFHYSYFWFIFEPFYKINWLEPAMFLVHVLATYATFWMFWELSNTLFHNPLTNFIATIAFIFPHQGLSGFQVIEYSLLNRSFVLPFLLAAIILYIRKHTLWAFLILGLMYNLHVLSVNYVMAMIVFDSVIRFKQVGWKNILLGFILFLAGALPVLIWRTGSSPIDLSLRPDLMSLAVTHGPLNTVYEWISTLPQVWINTLDGLGALAFFIIGRQIVAKTPETRIATNFVIAIGIVVLVETITTYWLPVTFLDQQQLLRIGFFLLIIGYLYFANFLSAEIQRNLQINLKLAAILGTFITFISPLLTLLIWGLKGWISKVHWRQVLTIGAWISIQGTFILIAIPNTYWAPGIHIYPQPSRWVDVEEWAKNNTPIDARFITPPQIYWFYTPDWRAISERATLVEYPEIMDVFDPAYLSSFEERFNAIAPGAIAKFDGVHTDDLKITGEAYYSLSAQDFEQVAQKYNISYLVVEKPHAYPFPRAYENEGFAVYDLSSALNAH